MDTSNLVTEAEHKRDEESFMIDITPTWEGQVRMCLMIISGATPQAVSKAQEELLRMGRILDHYAEREV